MEEEAEILALKLARSLSSDIERLQTAKFEAQAATLAIASIEFELEHIRQLIGSGTRHSAR